MTGIEKVELARREKMARVVKSWLLCSSLEILLSVPELPLNNIFNEASTKLLTEFGLYLSEEKTK